MECCVLCSKPEKANKANVNGKLISISVGFEVSSIALNFIVILQYTIGLQEYNHIKMFIVF